MFCCDEVPTNVTHIRHFNWHWVDHRTALESIKWTNLLNPVNAIIKQSRKSRVYISCTMLYIHRWSKPHCNGKRFIGHECIYRFPGIFCDYPTARTSSNISKLTCFPLDCFWLKIFLLTICRFNIILQIGPCDYRKYLSISRVQITRNLRGLHNW